MEFEGDSNIGLYMFANDKFCILGKQVSQSKKKEIEKVLKVPVYNATVIGTELMGVFVSGNNDYILIPDMYDYEMEIFEKITKKHNIKLIHISNTLNTYGNNICFGNKKILLNSKYSNDFKKKLENETEHKCIIMEVEDYENIGALCIYKNSRYFLSSQITEENAREIASQVSGVGTVNSGSNYISSGIVSNSNGLILGFACSTIEIQNITESLNYI